MKKKRKKIKELLKINELWKKIKKIKELWKKRERK